MSTVLTPGQGATDELPAGMAPAGRLRRATSGSIGRLGGAPGVWLLTIALALASVAVFVTLILPMPAYDENQLPWWFFALAFGAAEAGVLHFSVRSQAVTISLAEIPLVIGFYFADPSMLVLSQLAGSAIALVVVRRQVASKLAFNLALFSLTSSLAIVVFRAVAPPDLDDVLTWWAASFLGATVPTVIGAPAIALVISISLRRVRRDALGAGLLFGVIAATVNTSLALVVIEFLRTNPHDLWLVLAPAAVAMLGYRALVAQREREARVEFLYACAGILGRPAGASDPNVEMLSLARDKFGADVAEILVAPGGNGGMPTRTAVGPGTALETMVPIETELFAARLAALAPAKPGAGVARSGRLHAVIERLAPQPPIHEITVLITIDDDVVGTLRVADRAAHRGSFRHDDVRLLETLGMHTGVALRNSGLLASLAESLANVSHLAAAVDASDDAILAMAPDATIVAWNPAAERLFGFRGDEIAGMSANTLVPSDRLEEVSARFGGLAAGHAPRHGPSEVVRKDGIRVPVSATVSPITDPAGTAVGFSAIIHDESAREAAEAALREREAMFRSMFQLGPIGMAMVDGHRTWTAANDALCRLLQRRPDEVIGRRSDAFVHPDDLAATREAEASLGAQPGERGHTARRRYLTPDGRTIWARVTERVLWSPEMGPGNTICVIEDITESHLASERARDTEARLHRAVVAFTAVREPTGVLKAVLTAARDLLHAEFVAIGVLSESGSEFVDLHFTGFDDATVAAIGRLPVGCGALSLSGPTTGSVRVREVTSHPSAIGFPPGHPVISSFLAVPIVFEGRLVARLYAANKQSDAEFDAEDESVATALAAQAAVVIENARINARTQALVDDLARANEELRRASDAKSDFLGTVSHELRTPLHSILVAAELVSDPVFGPLSEERARELGATIQGSGRHLLGLIDDLVDLARIEAGRIDLRIVEMPLAPLLAEIHHEVAPLARRQSIGLECRCEPDVMIHADPLRIRQVLVNLLANAVKFSKQGARVWVEVRRTPEAVEISVHDTGVGIRPEDLTRIFEPFDQVSEVPAPGAGLGLAIARRLVDLHGGGLTVTSAHGTGSVFRIALPEHSHAPEHRAGVRASRDPRLPLDVPSSPVLVVEDDLTALGLIADVLVRSGYAVRTATDLAGAIEAVAALAPSLVLLDMRLGAEDGLDLARRLRADPATRSIPILALSADAMQQDVERVMEAECNGHVAKPVVARDLLRRIQALLEAAAAADGTDAPGVPTSAGGRGA